LPRIPAAVTGGGPRHVPGPTGRDQEGCAAAWRTDL